MPEVVSAACTNSVLRYLLPRLEILPRMVRSPVDSCFGTSPSQAPKVASLLEAGAIADRRHHGARDDRADARHRHQALATLILLRQCFDLGRHARNAVASTVLCRSFQSTNSLNNASLLA